MTTSQILEMILPSDIVTTVMMHVSADVIVSAARRWLNLTRDAREFRRIALDFGKRVLEEENALGTPEHLFPEYEDEDPPTHYYSVNIHVGDAGMFFMEATEGVGSDLSFINWLDESMMDEIEADVRGLCGLLEAYPNTLSYLQEMAADRSAHARELNTPDAGIVFVTLKR